MPLVTWKLDQFNCIVRLSQTPPNCHNDSDAKYIYSDTSDIQIVRCFLQISNFLDMFVFVGNWYWENGVPKLCGKSEDAGYKYFYIDQ